MLLGKQTWSFPSKPKIIATGVTGGPFEREGLLGEAFDYFFDDLWMGEDSYEKAHRKLIDEATTIALRKANIEEKDIQFFIAGDLINQITPTSFAARTLKIPYFGLFGACSTSMEGLALAAFIVDKEGAKYVLTGASSHNAAAERQFRYPTEYGGQKPPTAQWTVTGAGFAIVSSISDEGEKVPKVESATIGKIVDMGLKDPFNMGGAMAPAAADTIMAHLKDTGRDHSYYDLIITGDLGEIGRASCLDLLRQQGIHIPDETFQDCGLKIYRKEQEVQAGASGAAASATVLYGHILQEMKRGTYNRILCVATGALHSPLSIQQNESIPCIAHAVSIEI